MTDYAGRVIITWPKAASGAVHGQTLAVADADTGQPICTTLDCTVRVDLRDFVTAEMTMLTDQDGQPLTNGAPVPPPDENGNYLTGAFRWLVAEMRIAE